MLRISKCTLSSIIAVEGVKAQRMMAQKNFISCQMSGASDHSTDSCHILWAKPHKYLEHLLTLQQPKAAKFVIALRFGNSNVVAPISAGATITFLKFFWGHTIMIFTTCSNPPE